MLCKVLVKMSYDSGDIIKISSLVYRDNKNDAFKVVRYAYRDSIKAPREIVFAGVIASTTNIINTIGTSDDPTEKLSNYFAFSILKSNKWSKDAPLEFNTYIIKAEDNDKALDKFYREHSNVDSSLVVVIALGYQYESSMQKIDYENIVIEHSIKKYYENGIYPITISSDSGWQHDNALMRTTFDTSDVTKYDCKFAIINFKDDDLSGTNID